MTQERLQKILAKVGIASRRKAEELILEGRVTVNGKVAQIGEKAELGADAIKVDGKLLHQGAETPVYLAFYKPRNVISMMADPQGRPTLADYLTKVHARLFPIGRLDFGTEGLILLTNDGDLAEKVQKREDIARVYHVKVKGHPDEALLGGLRKGAKIGNRLVKPHSVQVSQDLENKAQVQIVFMGGGVMDVKALFEMKGFLVDKIVRTAIGHLTLRGIVPGHYRLLKQSQMQALVDQPELGMKLLEKADEEIEKSRVRERMDERHALPPVKPIRIRPAGKSAPAGDRPIRIKPRSETSDRPEREDRPARPERSFSRSDKPYRGDRPFRGERPGFSSDRPKRSFSRPERSSGEDRPSFSSDRPKRSFSRPERSFGGDRPSFSSDRPKRSFGGDRPSFSSDRPKRSFSRPERSFGGDRPSFSSDRPKRSFSRPDKPFRGDRPSRSPRTPRPVGSGPGRAIRPVKRDR